MKMNRCTMLSATLVALIVTITLPAFAQDAFTRAKRVASESVDHYGAVESEQTSVNPRQVFVKTWGISRVKSLAFVTRK